MWLYEMRTDLFQIFSYVVEFEVWVNQHTTNLHTVVYAIVLTMSITHLESTLNGNTDTILHVQYTGAYMPSIQV